MQHNNFNGKIEKLVVVFHKEFHSIQIRKRNAHAYWIDVTARAIYGGGLL